MSYQNRLNYSLGNETWHAESQALAMRPGDHVVCVTASGDRPLHLLLADPVKIASVDINPIQNHLLELKIAAIGNLSYAHYLEFMGIRFSTNRVETYRKLEYLLSQPAAIFWSNNLAMISNGVLFAGKTERYCLFVARFLRLLFGRKATTLLSFNSVAEQARYIDEVWDSRIHHWIYRLSVHIPKIPRLSVFDDPGLHAYVDRSIDPGRYMYDRKNAYLRRGLARTSILLQLIYRGELKEDGLPAYLKKENFHILKDRLDRIEIYTGDITSYLEQSTSTFDIFSLSDVASYMPYEKYVKTLAAMRTTANPGARFCLREYMTRYGVPVELRPHIVRYPHREFLAELSESNFVYRFLAGIIV